MMNAVIDYDEELQNPEFIFYYSDECPVCRRFVRIVDELDFRLVIPIDRVNVSTRRDDRYMWWANFCNEKVGDKIVPLLVFWKYGFERGVPHIIALSRKYEKVITKSIEERIATLSRDLMVEFSRYMYVREII